MQILTFGFHSGGYRKEWDEDDTLIVFDARELPDPVSVPDLCMLDGRDKRVQQFMFDIPGVSDWLDEMERLAGENKHFNIAIGCFGGVHRSVALAELLGKRLKIKPQHLDLERRWERYARQGRHIPEEIIAERPYLLDLMPPPHTDADAPPDPKRSFNRRRKKANRNRKK